MTIFMKDIYNIYESLLDDIDTTMKNGKNDIEKYLDTQPEKFVKIVSLAGGFNTEERIIFRDLINDIVRDKYMECHIPKKLRDLLIVASKRKLKVKDFELFSKSEDAYNRYCNSVYNMLQSKVLINDIKQDIKEIFYENKAFASFLVRAYLVQLDWSDRVGRGEYVSQRLHL